MNYRRLCVSNVNELNLKGVSYLSACPSVPFSFIFMKKTSVYFSCT